MFSNLKDVYKKAVSLRKKVSCQLKETVFRGSGGEGTGRQGIST